MKSRFLKPSMPLAIVLLAVAGAFASQGPKKVAPTQIGWVDTPTPCMVSQNCRTEVGEFCTLIHQGVEKRAYGKETLNGNCETVLYKIP